VSGPAIIGIGSVSIDELLYVERHPGTDGKSPLTGSRQAFGGLSGTALVAAARLGARCAYAGRLGTDDASLAVENNLRRHGVDTSLAARSTLCGVVRAVITVSAQPPGRSILYQKTGLIGAHPTEPAAEVLVAARVLLCDANGADGALRAARLMRSHGGAVVGDLEVDAGLSGAVMALLAEIDHLILAQHDATALCGSPDPALCVQRLWTPRRVLVAVTSGAQGCWWRDATAAVRHQPAFPVTISDSTGCGDVFHGAYAEALTRGLPVDACLRWAAAAAALKASGAPGHDGCPRAAQVHALLAAHPQGVPRAITMH